MQFYTGINLYAFNNFVKYIYFHMYNTHNVSTFLTDVGTCVHVSNVQVSCNGKVENVQYAKLK